MPTANWDLFRVFSVVARTGSVNRAAAELGMSQPTLSRRLKELEGYVNAPLFFRASSGVKLTPEGEDLSRATADIVDAFDSFQRGLLAQMSRRSTVVRISATEGLTKHWLLSRMRKLREGNARISLEILASVQQQNLANSDLDFVIRMGDPGDIDLIGKKVATASFGVFASQEYLFRRGAPQSLLDLNDHDIIGHVSEFQGLTGVRNGQPLFDYFSPANHLRSCIRLNLAANHSAAAAEGLGLALLVIPFARAEGLVRVLPAEVAMTNIWLLRRQESDLRRLTRQVRKFLENEFADSKHWFEGETQDRRPARVSAKGLERAGVTELQSYRRKLAKQLGPLA